MINQCLIMYECNLKRMKLCKYYKLRENNEQEAAYYKNMCNHLVDGLHCVNIQAIKEALDEEYHNFL